MAHRGGRGWSLDIPSSWAGAFHKHHVPGHTNGETGAWLSVWQGRCLLTMYEPPCDFKLCWGKKNTNFKCRGNKNTPSLNFILSLWTNAVLVFKTTSQMAIRFLNRKSTVPRTDRKITASSYYLVIWKIFDWGNKVLHWRAWVISCRQKKQNQISVKPPFTPKTYEHPIWAQ